LSAHVYDELGFAPDQNAFVLLGRMFTAGYCNQVGNDVSGPVAHFDIVAGTWSFSVGAQGANDSTNIPATEFDPISRKFVIFGRQGLDLYDPATRTQATFVSTFTGGTLKTSTGSNASFSALGYANQLVYSAPDDTFYFFARGSPVVVYALKLNRTDPKLSTLDKLASTGPTSSASEPGYAYDSRNHVIGGAVSANVFYAFDPATAAWSQHPIQGGLPGDESFHAVGYDPVNNVFVFLSAQHETWAFRLHN
jgi:hypothetical protein